MIADIFYPISTLTITVLAYFIRKKKCLGALHSRLHQGTTLDPLGAYNSPQTPSCNCFWLCQKPMHPYFFCIIPWGMSPLTKYVIPSATWKMSSFVINNVSMMADINTLNHEYKRKYSERFTLQPLHEPVMPPRLQNNGIS